MVLYLKLVNKINKIKIVKDNVLLSIEEEELAQYEARGYSKLGATKKVASKDLEKELKKIAKTNIDGARDRLLDIMCNYQGYKKCVLILVFDAYKVKGQQREVSMYHNIHVVYTKEAETADMYIEKTTHRLGRKNKVTVATSDGLEQLIIMGQGALRMSARGLKEEIERAQKEIREGWITE